tara:strand:- start:370 stop:624 length:255 start_codon:yes stop_codon:yes gene_type:complete
MAETIIKEEVFELFSVMEDDESLSKNIKGKIQDISSSLKDDSSTSAVRIDKAIQTLDEMAEDSNTPDFIRTQIWSIVSLLESIE